MFAQVGTESHLEAFNCLLAVMPAYLECRGCILCLVSIQAIMRDETCTGRCVALKQNDSMLLLLVFDVTKRGVQSYKKTGVFYCWILAKVIRTVR